MKRDPYIRALNNAYRLLSIRERSEREIRQRLKDKGYGRETEDRVIKDLKSKDLVDDSRFVQAWIKDRSTVRPKGILAIKSELIKKGVDGALIDAALKDRDIGYNEYEVAKALINKKFGTTPLLAEKGLDRGKRKKSIYAHLAQRGFSFDIINDIIDTI